ncbi:MAG: hypothetical protein PHV68_02085, partial [Candidatus Gastranaerophilales bacterium]|nr:hypothetical protein [Candidatus Gastranaerophilales bacterium]
PDICILPNARLACCPSDAVDVVKNICIFISSKKGGEGALREFTDFIIYNQSHAFEKISQKFALAGKN